MPVRGRVDVVSIPAGTKVNSYYVHADAVGSANVEHRFTGSIRFGTPVLAIAASTADLAATNRALGNPATTYSTDSSAGLDWGDSATTAADGTSVSLGLSVWTWPTQSE